MNFINQRTIRPYYLNNKLLIRLIAAPAYYNLLTIGIIIFIGCGFQDNVIFIKRAIFEYCEIQLILISKLGVNRYVVLARFYSLIICSISIYIIVVNYYIIPGIINYNSFIIKSYNIMLNICIIRRYNHTFLIIYYYVVLDIKP